MPEKLIGGRAGDREHMRIEDGVASSGTGKKARGANPGSKWRKAPLEERAFSVKNPFPGEPSRIPIWTGQHKHGQERLDHRLLCASEHGDVEMMKEYLGAGADKNARNYYKRTPLMEASWSGMADAVKLLLRNKAGLDLQDMRGKTALMYAAECGHVEIVMLLIRARANADLKDDGGETAVDKAKRRGHLEVIHILSQVESN